MSENKLKVAHDQLKALQGVASKNFEDGAQVNKIESIIDGWFAATMHDESPLKRFLSSRLISMSATRMIFMSHRNKISPKCKNLLHAR